MEKKQFIRLRILSPSHAHTPPSHPSINSTSYFQSKYKQGGATVQFSFIYLLSNFSQQHPRKLTINLLVFLS